MGNSNLSSVWQGQHIVVSCLHVCGVSRAYTAWDVYFSRPFPLLLPHRPPTPSGERRSRVSSGLQARHSRQPTGQRVLPRSGREHGTVWDHLQLHSSAAASIHVQEARTHGNACGGAELQQVTAPNDRHDFTSHYWSVIRRLEPVMLWQEDTLGSFLATRPLDRVVIIT